MSSSYADNVFLNVPFDRKYVQLPAQASDLKLDRGELTFGDYSRMIAGWLTKNPW